jgi:hypothetical protein
MNEVMILGGYGHFGLKIAEALIQVNIPVIIVGRSEVKLSKALYGLHQKYPQAKIGGSCFDIHQDLDDKLKALKPLLIIHTCGPFQNQDYLIASICIANQVHYLDISDGREYVRDISLLNDLAVSKNISVISGASSVPGLTSAVIEEFKPLFSQLEHMEFGISSGQQTPGGVATTNAILSYAGKEIPSYTGWQGLHRILLPECGKRWQSYCSIPDLDLFPKQYGFKSIEFYGGVESSFLHLSLWCMSWLVRWGLPIKLSACSNLFYRVSKAFSHSGSDAGGLYIFLTGKDLQNNEKKIKWYIIAKQNHGLFIPTIPAIVMAKKIFHGQYTIPGARPCVGLVTLQELLAEMHAYDISVFT